MKNIEELKQQWLKDSKVNEAYAQMQPAFALASTLIAARSRVACVTSKGSGVVISVTSDLLYHLNGQIWLFLV
jgi:hypothetical protein